MFSGVTNWFQRQTTLPPNETEREFNVAKKQYAKLVDTALKGSTVDNYQEKIAQIKKTEDTYYKETSWFGKIGSYLKPTDSNPNSLIRNDIKETEANIKAKAKSIFTMINKKIDEASYLKSIPKLQNNEDGYEAIKQRYTMMQKTLVFQPSTENLAELDGKMRDLEKLVEHDQGLNKILHDIIEPKEKTKTQCQELISQYEKEIKDLEKQSSKHRENWLKYSKEIGDLENENSRNHYTIEDVVKDLRSRYKDAYANSASYALSSQAESLSKGYQEILEKSIGKEKYDKIRDLIIESSNGGYISDSDRDRLLKYYERQSSIETLTDLKSKEYESERTFDKKIDGLKNQIQSEQKKISEIDKKYISHDEKINSQIGRLRNDLEDREKSYQSQQSVISEVKSRLDSFQFSKLKLESGFFRGFPSTLELINKKIDNSSKKEELKELKDKSSLLLNDIKQKKYNPQEIESFMNQCYTEGLINKFDFDFDRHKEALKEDETNIQEWESRYNTELKKGENIVTQIQDFKSEIAQLESQTEVAMRKKLTDLETNKKKLDTEMAALKDPNKAQELQTKIDAVITEIKTVQTNIDKIFE